MDNSMRMLIIAGVLMLALLIAIVGSVSADVPIWQTTARAGSHQMESHRLECNVEAEA
jgi:hypothetical protein